MEKQAKLKPCPFCGGPISALQPVNDSGIYFYYIYCAKCGAEGPLYRDENMAIAAWNRRKP